MILKDEAVFQEAIKMEVDAQKLYTKLYDKAKTQNGKSLFEALVVEEQKHEAILKDFLNTRNVEASKVKVEVYQQGLSIQSKILDPGYDQFELADGIKLAIQLERKAAKFYIDAFNYAEKIGKDLALKNILIALTKEEKHHESLLIDAFRTLFGYWTEE